MSAEIHTSLFLLTAEIAAVSGIAALLMMGLAWGRGRARLKAAQALRDAAQRLPGEDGIAQQERELLGEFARAYLTQDGAILAALPMQLHKLRQNIEAAVTATAMPEADATQAQAQALQLLETTQQSLQAKIEGLEQQNAQIQQHLDTALATINTLIQEYGRGRGEAITPTAEALLQALLQIQGTKAVVAGTPLSAGDALPRIEAKSEITEKAMGDRPEDAHAKMDAQGRAPASDAAKLTPEASPAVAETDLDAPREDAPEAEATMVALPLEAAAKTMPPPPASPQDLDDRILDLSVPMETVETLAPSSARDSEAGKDELDELDIEALLDAELERQAALLKPDRPLDVEDYDIARWDDGVGAKKP